MMDRLLYLSFALLVQSAYANPAQHVREMEGAIRNSNLELVRELGADIGSDSIDTRLSNGRTLLHSAVGRYSALKARLRVLSRPSQQSSPELESKFAKERLVLERDRTRALEIIRYLLQTGADPNMTNRQGSPTIFLLKQHYEIDVPLLELLIKHGARINSVDRSGNTILLQLLKHSDRNLDFKPLIRLGADVNISNKRGDMPLMMAIRWKPEATVRLFLSEGSNIHASDNRGTTPLHVAASSNNWRAMRLLLQAGADLDAVDRSGFTPLSYAARKEEWNMVRRLLKKGANANVNISSSAKTVAHVIMERPALGLISYLKRENLRENPKAKLGGTLYQQSVLDYAVRTRNVDAVKKYLDLGVDPNSGAGSYTVPLLEVVKTPWEKILAKLEESGEAASGKPKSANAFLTLRRQAENSKKIFALLVRHGADPDTADNKGMTALMVAADVDNSDAVRVLLRNRADVNRRDEKGATALMYAVTKGRWGITNILIDRGADVSIGSYRDRQRAGGISLMAVGTPENLTLIDAGNVDKWPLQEVLSHYQRFLREGMTERERNEQYSKDRAAAEKKDKEAQISKDLSQSLLEELEERITRLKAILLGTLNSLKAWWDERADGKAHGRLELEQVDDRDYGDYEFALLLVKLMQKMPENYELNLDESQIGQTYRAIFSMEGINPIVVVEARNLNVQYKRNGPWVAVTRQLITIERSKNQKPSNEGRKKESSVNFPDKALVGIK